MSLIRQVREDDGTLVPFRERKVADSVHAALIEGGMNDRALAEDLAGLVTLFLEKRFGEQSGVPTIDDVQDVVERVLEETGNTRAAKSFRRQREQREEMRDLVTVREPAARGADDVVLPDDAASDDRITRWSRARLMRTLTDDAELPPSLADEVAVAVERRVFASGLNCVTADFVRQLVEHELFTRGIGNQKLRDDRVVVLRSEVSPYFTGEDTGPTPADRAVSSPILARFALTEMHGPAVARAHREGRIHLHSLDRPFAVERLIMPVDLVARPDVRAFPRALIKLRHALDSVRDHVAGAVELSGLIPWVAERIEASDAESAAEDLALALSFDDAFDRSAGPSFEIDIPVGGFGPGSAGDARAALTRALLTRLVERPALHERWRVTLLAPPTAPAELDALGMREAARELVLGRPDVRLSVLRDSDSDPWASEPSRAPVPLHVSIARTTINLPLLLLDVAGRGLKDALPELNDGLSLVLDAFRERFWQQRRGAPFGIHGVVVRFGGPGEVQVRADAQSVDLEVWGLPVALELLVLRGVIPRSMIPEAAARILGYIDYTVAEEHDGVSLRVRLGGCRSRTIRRRLFSAAEQIARRYAISDLLSLLKQEHAAEGVLPVAAPLFERKNAPLLEAPLLGRLGFGLSVPAPALPDPLAHETLARLRSETRFARFGVTRETSADGLFEVQEELFA